MKPAARAKLFNQCGDAWADGRIDWLFDARGNVVVRIWCELARGSGGVDAADAELLRMVRSLPERKFQNKV